MSIILHRCTGCGCTLYPARLICYRCGGADWTTVTADRGRVEEITTVRYQADAGPGTIATSLATVRTGDGEVVLVARLSRAAEPREEVDLALSPNGGVIAS